MRKNVGTKPMLLLAALTLLLVTLCVTASAAERFEIPLTTPVPVSENASASDDYVYIISWWNVDDAVSSSTSDSNIKSSYIKLLFHDENGVPITPVDTDFMPDSNFHNVVCVSPYVHYYLSPDHLETLNAKAHGVLKFPADSIPAGVQGEVVSEIGSARAFGLTGTFYVCHSEYVTKGELGSLQLGQKTWEEKDEAAWSPETFLASYNIRSTDVSLVSCDSMYLPKAGETVTLKLNATAMTDLGTDAGAFRTPATVTKAEVRINSTEAEGVSVSADGGSVAVKLTDGVYNAIAEENDFGSVFVSLYVTMPGRSDGVWTSYVTQYLERPSVALTEELADLTISGAAPKYRTAAKFTLAVTEAGHSLPESVEISVGSEVLSPSCYSYDAGTGKITIPAEHVLGDITVTAAAEYKVSYDANGGSGTMTVSQAKLSEAVTLKANKYDREGYVFVGWNTEADGSGTPYADGATVSFSANAVLYAQWTKLFAVSAFPTEGGTVSGGGVYGDGTSAVVTATADEGYVFVNWTENGAVVSSDASYTFTVSSDRVLTANFEEKGPGVWLNAAGNGLDFASDSAAKTVIVALYTGDGRMLSVRFATTESGSILFDAPPAGGLCKAFVLDANGVPLLPCCVYTGK